MFYLSTSIGYGLNLLVILARQQQRMSLKQVAKQGHMPYRFLTKIVKQLTVAKLIQAKEGKHGGYSLSQNPKKIKIKTIFDALGEPLSLALCLSDKHCPMVIEKKCKMRSVWLKIKKNIDYELNHTTLADLI